MAHTVFSDKMAGPLNEPPSPATARPKSPNRYVLERGDLPSRIRSRAVHEPPIIL